MEIYLHGELGAQFGTYHRKYVDTPMEAVNMFCRMYPGFKDVFAAEGAGYAVIVGDKSHGIDILTVSIDEPLHFVPMIEAAKDEGTQILLGAIIVAASVMFGNAYSASKGALMIANAGVGIGSSMMLGGIAQLLAPSPKTSKNLNDKEDGSALFNGAINTAGPGAAQSLIYGIVEVGSHVLSTMMTSDDPGARWTGVISGTGVAANCEVLLESNTTARLDTIIVEPFRGVLVGGGQYIAMPYDTTIVNSIYSTLETSIGSVDIGANTPLVLQNGSVAMVKNLVAGDTLANGVTIVSPHVPTLLKRDLYTYTMPYAQDIGYTAGLSYITLGGLPVSPSIHIEEVQPV